jgi:hypothetical protein
LRYSLFSLDGGVEIAVNALFLAKWDVKIYSVHLGVFDSFCAKIRKKPVPLAPCTKNAWRKT